MSEGVSFMAVRRFIFACAPRSFHAFVQLAGRAVRIGSHKDLPASERTVHFDLFIAVIPRCKSEDQRALEELVCSASTMVGAVKQFRAQSVSASTDGTTPWGPSPQRAPQAVRATAGFYSPRCQLMFPTHSR